MSMKFLFKKKIFFCDSLISPSLDKLQCSPIVHMNRIEPIFPGLHFYAPRRSPYTTINLVTLSWGWNPFLGACSDLDI